MTARDFEKEQNWKEKLEKYQSSGLSQAAWCKENNEKFHIFKYWQQKLKTRRAMPMKFEEIEDTTNYTIEIRKKEITIYLPNGLDQKTLKDCLSALEKGSC